MFCYEIEDDEPHISLVRCPMAFPLEETIVHTPNIGNILTRTAEAWPTRTGLICGDRSWTWRELEANANAFALSLIKLGVRFGNRVAIQSPNTRAMLETSFAIIRTGAVYVPITARASVAETMQMLRLCDAKVAIFDETVVDFAVVADRDVEEITDIVVVGDVAVPNSPRARWHRHSDLLAQAGCAPTVSVDVLFNDICWHNFTSGTTGVPKGGMNTHGNVLFALLNRLAEVTPGLGVDDCLLTVAPISHGTGTMTTANILVGGRIVIPETHRFDAELYWHLIERHRVTAMFVVPTILMRLLNSEAARSADMSSLRHVVLTGAATSPSDLDRATDMLGEALVQYYGAVELVGGGTVIRPALHPDQRQRERRSIGRPRIGSDLRIVAPSDLSSLHDGEIGEICVRGPGTFAGYYKDEDATANVLQDGWYRTGDLGFRDTDGLIYLTGRLKEMFKSGGLQVYPNEVQDLLADHPDVAEAHVLSVPDTDLGEIGIGVVVLHPGAVIREAELHAHLAKRLSRYKQPRRIFIVDETPKSGTHKVPKARLREMLLRRDLIEEGCDVARLQAAHTKNA